jgi:hypothetical protein
VDEGHLEVQGGETIPVPSVDWSARCPVLERLFATHLVEDCRVLYAGPAGWSRVVGRALGGQVHIVSI